MKTYLREQREKWLDRLERYVKTDIRYLVHGGFWIMMGKVIFFLLSFLTLLAFSHWVTKDTYGTYQYVISVMGVASIASLPGVNVAMIKSVAQGKEGSFMQGIHARIRFATIGSVCLLVVSAYYFAQHGYILGATFLATSIFLPFMQSSDSFEYFWNGRKNFKRATWYLIITTAVPAFLLIATLWKTSNILYITLILLIANTASRWIAVYVTHSYVENTIPDEHLLSLGKSLTLVQGIDMISGYIDKIFLWKFTTPASVAIYSFAQIPILKAQQITPIQMLALPKLSNKNISDEKKTILVKFLKLFLVTIPVTVFILLVAPLFFKWFFPQYTEALPYFNALSLIVVLGPCVLLNSALIAAMKKREIVGIQTASLIGRIILFCVLVPLWGIWGTVVSVISTELFKDALTLYFFLQI